MIRAFDRFYRKHPNVAFGVMLVICAAVLYVAHGIDADNTAIMRMQMMAPTSRSAT